MGSVRVTSSEGDDVSHLKGFHGRVRGGPC